MAEQEKPLLSCEELLRSLNEYIDDQSVAAVCREFAQHLAGCNPCQLVVDNIRRTIQLFKDGKPYPIPPECTARLNEILRERWKAAFPESQ
ncbi:MAG TPA: zf-HC2 domain-containing protein [Gemmata sp.]|nr:zf-HC2 domain-containing protein [Gemmata sp.]